MNLIDLMEMFFDWLSATKRHNDGDIKKSIEINKSRFGYDDLLANIFRNTADYIDGWFYDAVEKQFNETDNENVRRIVYDWFTSVCVDTEEYKRKYTEDENKDAHDIILSLISMGLG